MKKINENTWNAIANLMDDEKREKTAFDYAPCTEEDFLDEYLKLDPEFEDILKSEFDIDIYKEAYEGIIVED